MTDQLSLMDSANMLGAVAGVVGAGYAGAAYHQQRKQEKEESRKEEDVEMGLRRSQGTQVEGREITNDQQQRAVAAEVTTTESTEYAYTWTGMR